MTSTGKNQKLNKRTFRKILSPIAGNPNISAPVSFPIAIYIMLTAGWRHCPITFAVNIPSVAVYIVTTNPYITGRWRIRPCLNYNRRWRRYYNCCRAAGTESQGGNNNTE
jgi:hypothetical protein